MPPKPPSRPAPAMGVKDGVRKDVDAAKEQGGGYNPNGVGVAWTHKFLNLKPWHPMNFRNREKVYLAEQRQYEDEQRKEQGKQEFLAEQEYLKTISMLSAEEQERYKQRQSVSWLYQKPPGFDAANAHPQANDNKNKNSDADGNNSDGKLQQGQPCSAATGAGSNDVGKGKRRETGRQGGNYLAKVVGGVQAVVAQQRQRFELKQQQGTAPGLSPPRGGGDPQAENQRLVVGELDSDEEERAYRLAIMSEDEKRKIGKEKKRERRQRARVEREREKAAELQRLQEAKEFLRTAGIQVPDSSSDSGNSSIQDEGQDSDGTRKQQKRRQRREKKKQRKNDEK